MLLECQERDLCRDDYQKAALELAQIAAYLANTFIVNDLVITEIAYAALRGAQIKCSVARGIYIEHVTEHSCDGNLAIPSKPATFDLGTRADLLAQVS